jgi:putative endonuclease
MDKGGYVYIMTNNNNTVLYTGVTSNLTKRIQEHIEHKYAGSFTSKYNIEKLLYYQAFSSIEEAIAREKQIKAGSRQKKINLVNAMNPGWENLYPGICGF